MNNINLTNIYSIEYHLFYRLFISKKWFTSHLTIWITTPM